MLAKLEITHTSTSSNLALQTFALSRNFVPEHIQLEHCPKLFKHFPKILLIHGSWDLSHKHLDGIGIRLSLGHL